MSDHETKDEGSKITSTEQPRVKDPKRVEAGRRLGAISRAAKEKKARERYDREREVEREAALANSDGMVSGSQGILTVGAVVLTVGLGYVLYNRKGPETGPLSDNTTEDQSNDPPQRRKRSVMDSRPSPRFDNFDE